MTATAATSSPELLVLHFLQIKGLASAEALATLTGLPADEVDAVLARALADGLAVRREGRVPGVRLTAEGRARAAELLGHDVDAPARRAALDAVYQAFLPLNERLKVVTSAWQVRNGAPNDHADPDYDRQVVDDLAAIHAEAARVLNEHAAALHRLARYPQRLGAALDRIRAGEHAALARPLVDSFHDAWMELHQDLLLSLGRDRSEADGH